MAQPSQPSQPPPTPDARLRPRRSLAVCALIGAAVMAAVDEIVFHQLLNWHHFYDRATPTVGLLSDGLLHTAELLGLVAGFVLYADLRRRRALSVPHARAGLFLGLGGFQLFDGIVDHKLLRLHQIRYGVDLLPYDLAWNAAGLVLLGIGAALAVRAGRGVRPVEAG
ncbi:DUF2243 domain-containing protein [Streptomyces sp. TRM 70361]|uniref:DUF2243 domain-containing protein n=1 Tax=Streptomyces sp. TRM 70361 TaxID=3116553 RepID=UPI002E7B654B|nr:DUF2243 domain-containing protein [Streptomyces sp. TRM 70361]MEE1940210.1 DUF2243 domain-containing protein [Streptomyces sp. TRM 70361]